MFNIGMMELVVVLLVAFLVVGPKDLPKVARWLARQLKQLKKFIREIKKETGWDEFAKEFKETADDLKSTVREADVLDEVKSTSKGVGDAVENVRKNVDDVAKELNRKIKL